MKRKLFYLWMFVAAAAATFTTSCEIDPFDDSAILDRLDDFDSRISALESWQKQVNDEIGALQLFVAALNDNDVFVTNVTETADGYRFTFSNGTEKTITGAKGDKGDKGDQGENGVAPVIGVQEIQGVYYWTVDGNLFPSKENPLRVTGEKGVTPQLRVDEEGYWEVSTDDGQTWASVKDAEGNPVSALGKNGAPGEKGDSFFESVEVSEDGKSVTITLADGQAFTLSVGERVLYFTSPAAGLDYDIETGEFSATLKVALGHDDVAAVAAQLLYPDEDTDVVYTRASNVRVEVPEVWDGTFKVYANVKKANAILQVRVVTVDDTEYTVSRAVSVPTAYVYSSIYTEKDGEVNWQWEEDWSINDYKHDNTAIKSVTLLNNSGKNQEYCVYVKTLFYDGEYTFMNVPEWLSVEKKGDHTWSIETAKGYDFSGGDTTLYIYSEDYLLLGTLYVVAEPVEPKVTAYAAKYKEDKGAIEWEYNGWFHAYETTPIDKEVEMLYFSSKQNFQHYIKFETEFVDEYEIRANQEWIEFNQEESNGWYFGTAGKFDPKDGGTATVTVYSKSGNKALCTFDLVCKPVKDDGGADDGSPKVTFFYGFNNNLQNDGSYQPKAQINFNVENPTVHIYYSSAEENLPSADEVLAAVKEEKSGATSTYTVAWLSGGLWSFNVYGYGDYYVFMVAEKDGIYSDVYSYADYFTGGNGNNLKATMTFEDPNPSVGGGGDDSTFAQNLLVGNAGDWLNISYDSKNSKIDVSSTTDAAVEKVYIMLAPIGGWLDGMGASEAKFVTEAAEKAFADYATTGKPSAGTIMYEGPASAGTVVTGHSISVWQDVVYIVLVDKDGKLTLRAGASIHWQGYFYLHDFKN